VYKRKLQAVRRLEAEHLAESLERLEQPPGVPREHRRLPLEEPPGVLEPANVDPQAALRLEARQVDGGQLLRSTPVEGLLGETRAEQTADDLVHNLDLCA
jgi:hypothetical protein